MQIYKHVKYDEHDYVCDVDLAVDGVKYKPVFYLSLGMRANKESAESVVYMSDGKSIILTTINNDYIPNSYMHIHRPSTSIRFFINEHLQQYETSYRNI